MNFTFFFNETLNKKRSFVLPVPREKKKHEPQKQVTTHKRPTKRVSHETENVTSEANSKRARIEVRKKKIPERERGEGAREKGGRSGGEKKEMNRGSKRDGFVL